MVFEKLSEIIANKLNIDKEEITLTKTFEDLGLDSLDIVEIVMEIEDAFGIEIEEDKNFGNVGDLVKYIEEKLQ
ncbi:acyl carrier protein [Caldicellulosiruptoraceae bacterium PP1]